MAKHPVVVYGASGYTGMLTMDWLIDQNIPFTAVARNAKRTQEMMAQRVVRLESATYEIVEADARRRVARARPSPARKSSATPSGRSSTSA